MILAVILAFLVVGLATARLLGEPFSEGEAMKLVRLISSETFGLFVDDWFMAVAIVALVLVAAPTSLVSNMNAGAMLLIGPAVVLVSSTMRAARQ